MKKLLYYTLLILPLFVHAQSKNTAKRLLMVVSSYGKDSGTIRPGYEFDEFSQAYLIFKNNGLQIEVASPKGGPVEADNFNKDKAYNAALLADKEALSLLENTKTTASIDAKNYDAIYIVGGKGAMFDLPYDTSLQDIISDMYGKKETVIASVCHGPAAFVNVKHNNEFIIKDVEITAFCNAEEALFGKKWVPEFPFSLETKLTERGAIFKQNDFMLSEVAISGQFVTGQNPFSTTKSAEAVLTTLGINPQPRILYKDEKSIYLIDDLLKGIKTYSWAEKELAAHKDSYDIQIIAVYGYYKILATETDTQALKAGIQLVELTNPHFFNEQLQLLLAKTYHKLGHKKAAKRILKELIAKELLIEEAQQLLKDIH